MADDSRDKKPKKDKPPKSAFAGGDAPDDAGDVGGGSPFAEAAPPTSPPPMDMSAAPDTMGGSPMGFEGGAMEPGMAQPLGVVEQNGGMFATFQEIETGIRGSIEFLMTLSGQFPGAGEPIRGVLTGLQQAEQGLLGVIQAVTVEAATPPVAAPRSAF